MHFDETWIRISLLLISVGIGRCLRGSEVVLQAKAKQEEQRTNLTAAQGDGVNKTKGPPLTGIPQIDYIYDPNLPRELNGHNLSDYPFYNAIPNDIEFACDGLHDGFYASVPHHCQVYHHCLFGIRYDFLCANYTAFDQKTFICHFVSEVDCVNSPKYYKRNEALYKTTTSAPIVIRTTKATAPPSVAAPPPRRTYPGRRRRPSYRRRPPASYEYYYDDEEEDDQLYDEEYYDDYPLPPKKRKSKPKGYRGRQDDYDDDVTESAPSKVQVVRPQGATGSVYDQPRVPPKIRRPVPINERSKYDYTSTTQQPSPGGGKSRQTVDQSEEEDEDYQAPKRRTKISNSRDKQRRRPDMKKRPVRVEYEDDYEEEEEERPKMKKVNRYEDDYPRARPRDRYYRKGGRGDGYRDYASERGGGSRKRYQGMMKRKPDRRPLYEEDEYEEYYDDEIDDGRNSRYSEVKNKKKSEDRRENQRYEREKKKKDTVKRERVSYEEEDEEEDDGYESVRYESDKRKKGSGNKERSRTRDSEKGRTPTRKHAKATSTTTTSTTTTTTTTTTTPLPEEYEDEEYEEYEEYDEPETPAPTKGKPEKTTESIETRRKVDDSKYNRFTSRTQGTTPQNHHRQTSTSTTKPTSISARKSLIKSTEKPLESREMIMPKRFKPSPELKSKVSAAINARNKLTTTESLKTISTTKGYKHDQYTESDTALVSPKVTTVSKRPSKDSYYQTEQPYSTSVFKLKENSRIPSTGTGSHRRPQKFDQPKQTETTTRNGESNFRFKNYSSRKPVEVTESNEFKTNSPLSYPERIIMNFENSFRTDFTPIQEAEIYKMESVTTTPNYRKPFNEKDYESQMNKESMRIGTSSAIPPTSPGPETKFVGIRPLVNKKPFKQVTEPQQKPATNGYRRPVQKFQEPDLKTQVPNRGTYVVFNQRFKHPVTDRQPPTFPRHPPKPFEITAPGPSGPEENKDSTLRPNYSNFGNGYNFPEEEYDVTLNDALQPSTLHPTRSLIGSNIQPKVKTRGYQTPVTHSSYRLGYFTSPGTQYYQNGGQDNIPQGTFTEAQEYETVVLPGPRYSLTPQRTQQRTRPREWYW